jgi:hypothetical protein
MTNVHSEITDPAEMHFSKFKQFAGDPNAVIPDFVGQLLCSTDTNKTYRATGAGAGSLVVVGGGGGSTPMVLTLDDDGYEPNTGEILICDISGGGFDLVLYPVADTVVEVLLLTTPTNTSQYVRILLNGENYRGTEVLRVEARVALPIKLCYLGSDLGWVDLFSNVSPVIGSAGNPSEPAAKAVIYTGIAEQQEISGLGFSPNLILIHHRIIMGGGYGSSATNYATNIFSDSFSENSYLQLKGFDEGYLESQNGVKVFGSDGFEIGGHQEINAEGIDYVAWCFNQSASHGLDVIHYIGTGSSLHSIGHSLGAVPEFIVVRATSYGDSWSVYNQYIGADPETKFLTWDYGGTENAGVQDASDADNLWGNTAPNSSAFYVGGVNSNGEDEDYVAFVFASVPGKSKFGFYTGNGDGSDTENASGPIVEVGFAPKMLMIKRVTPNYSESGPEAPWFMWDAARSPSNPRMHVLNLPETEGESDFEHLDSRIVHFNATSFQIRSNYSDFNGNNSYGSRFLYFCWG